MSGVNLSSVGPSKSKPGARGSFRFSTKRLALSAFALFFTALPAFGQSSDSIVPGPKPPDAPAEWRRLVGIYSSKEDPKITFILLERNGKLFLHDDKGVDRMLVFADKATSTPEAKNTPPRSVNNYPDRLEGLIFCCRRVDPGSDSSRSRIQPTRPIEDLRREALASTPPVEKGPFRNPDLVELTTLGTAIHLDIRYATSNDFLGVPVYTQARAFLQRPAAESLLRALHKLQPLGYGLLIHDGYRPWYVTKIFWDATPQEGKIFVADPAQGSRHNRGCAVDLTLYDLKTGDPVEMTGEYDEMSPRSFPNYPGGTSLQRWHRDLLRRAMESEGFTVYEAEWWHFDYKDWREYGILNIPFEKLNIGSLVK